MAKINRPNNVVTLGQTAPVGIGQGTVEQSLPVVIATDQPAIPVEEQNKVQSEVALSLLGIPRSEVALGIFADVNTYDVDPGEWTQLPVERREFIDTDKPFEYEGLPSGVKLGHGLSHVPEEAGALLEAPRNKSAVLTSKRFFRYQPGRVSAATFGVKSSVSSNTLADGGIRNPAIRKYGIYDNFDGYYWETRDAGIGDQFCVARRTQALIKYRTDFSITGQQEDYGIVGSDDATACEITLDATVSNSKTISAVDVPEGTARPKAGMKIYDVNGNSFIPANTRIESVSIDDNDTPETLTLVLSNAITVGTDDLASATFKCDFSGDLVIVRDKLLLSHAAIYDPTLLKDEEKFAFVGTDDSGAELIIDESHADSLEAGQMVMYVNEESDPSSNNYGLTTEILIIKSIATNDSPGIHLTLTNITGSAITFTAAGSPTPSKHFLKTPVPFIFPAAPDTGGKGSAADIMWPYARDFGFDDSVNSKRSLFDDDTTIGAIDTTRRAFGEESNGQDNPTFSIKTDVDETNNGEKCITLSNFASTQSNFVSSPVLKQAWSNWIRHNVKSKFYSVYEYRVPRSRFSFDFLDGSTDNSRAFSDFTKVATDGDNNRKYPGDPVLGDNAAHTSVFDIDFANVLMKKIEFSWYGAVGALFLVYVPVGNGEARWVRVHHLRASNQLKVASLGNATLPLTYTVYGGGASTSTKTKTFGRPLNSTTAAYPGGKTASDFVIKYGSSYYIDGGDRGTVKLFNHSNDTLVDLESHVYQASKFLTNSPSDNSIELIYGDISLKGSSTDVGLVDDILVGSKVITGNAADTNLRVVFVERLSNTDSPSLDTIRLHLNKAIAESDSPHDTIEFVTETGQSVYGLTSKTEIQSSQEFLVRNRIQVYPTKLATSLISSSAQGDAVKLELNKNVIFQDNIIHSILDESPIENLTPTGTVAQRTLEISGLATTLTSGTNVTGDFNSLLTTSKLYGWFFVEDSDGGNERALFGFIRKISDNNFEFVPLDSYTDTLVLKSGIPFLYAKQYGANGAVITTNPGADATTEIERLSSINIVEKQQRPIVGTGTTIATFFLEKGSEYFDLSAYFDYNKDYISFPLTDIPDNLFLNLKTDDTSWSGKVGASVTWEEQ